MMPFRCRSKVQFYLQVADYTESIPPVLPASRKATSAAQRGPAARPLREYGEQYLHHYWEPDEAQPHLLERGWSKQSGSLACAVSYRSARLRGAQQSGGQRFDRDATAFCREGQQAG